MDTIFDRTEKLLGKDAMELLKRKRVLVFGLGGVGGHLVEALARAGIGNLGIVDSDTVDITNINRQIIALHSNLGQPKVKVMEERIADINPKAFVRAFYHRLSSDTLELFNLEDWDYIADAIDDVAAKTLLIGRANSLGKPIISAMGAGNKMDPGCFKIADLEKTHTCPLARIMRKEIRKLGIKGVKTVFSTEEPKKILNGQGSASISFVPSVAGLLMAGEIVNDLLCHMK
ncbi:MAG: tRNA threonylcarbamoyladenosine dehydratase [Anaerovoracaceae bacterium]|jgi:tRNA A37 threonylcarbamoyladenosine dehydratase